MSNQELKTPITEELMKEYIEIVYNELLLRPGEARDIAIRVRGKHNKNTHLTRNTVWRIIQVLVYQKRAKIHDCAETISHPSRPVYKAIVKEIGNGKSSKSDSW